MPDYVLSRIHAYRDLKAYVCTLGGSECDAEFFGDRDSWFEHELRKHRCQYTCILCSKGIFSFDSLQAHILTTHGHMSDPRLKMLREAGRENPTGFKAEDCPFCDEWAEKLLPKTSTKGKPVDSTQDILVNHDRFKRHVATHQEQLAIFAIPRATGDREMSGPGSTATSNSLKTSVSPLKVDEDPIEDTVNELHSIPLSNTNNPPIDMLNDNISTTTNIDDPLDMKRKKKSLLSAHDSKIQSIILLDNEIGTLV